MEQAQGLWSFVSVVPQYRTPDSGAPLLYTAIRRVVVTDCKIKLGCLSSTGEILVELPDSALSDPGPVPQCAPSQAEDNVGVNLRSTCQDLIPIFSA